MPSWIIKERPSGDVANIKIVLDGVIIEGFIQDCDGDFIAYSVKDNGNVVVQGELRHTPEMTHDQCWLEAKRLSNLAIMAGNKPVITKEVHKPRVVKDFADIGVPAKRQHDHLDAPLAKKKANKHEKGDRRVDRDDKWADA